MSTNEELIAEAREYAASEWRLYEDSAVAGQKANDGAASNAELFAALADALEALLPKEVQTVEELEWGVRHAQGTRACRDRAEAEEGFAREVAYDNRRQLAYQGRAAIVTRRPAGPWRLFAPPATPTSTQGEER